MLKQLKNNKNMAVQLKFDKTEDILYMEEVLWGDSSTRIKFGLSESEKRIYIHADWVDKDLQNSVETDIAKVLSKDINRDAGREVVKCFSNCIEAKDSHIYFKLFEFYNYTTVEVYERKFKVQLVK